MMVASLVLSLKMDIYNFLCCNVHILWYNMSKSQVNNWYWIFTVNGLAFYTICIHFGYCLIFLYLWRKSAKTIRSELDGTFLSLERKSVHVYWDAGRRGRCSPAHCRPGTRDGSCNIGTFCKYLTLCWLFCEGITENKETRVDLWKERRNFKVVCQVPLTQGCKICL